MDGIDIKQYSFEQLREQIGVVPQRAVLFTGTIESNLKWGNEHATKEQMEQALRIAQAEEFVSRLPKGLQTEVFRRTKTASDHCPRIGGTAEDFDFGR